MSRQEVLDILSRFKAEHADEYGIMALGVFGSYARNEMKQDSDVDVVVKVAKPNLFKLSRIRIDLVELLHSEVDIVAYREKMNKFLKDRIDTEAYYV